MQSGIVYFEEIVENIKDATGYGNLRPYYNRIKRFIFNVENEIGYGGVLVLKKKEYTKGDQLYDGRRLIIPFDYVAEWSGGDLSMGIVQGNVFQLYDNGPEKIDFKYVGFLLDENGNPFTTRNRLNAVVAYAVYRLYSQQVFMRKGAANQYQMYREEYFDRVLEARGDDAFPTEAQWNQLGAIKNGGTFEAMTDCGMKMIYQGSNDPSVLNIDVVEPVAVCVGVLKGSVYSVSIVEGIIAYTFKLTKYLQSSITNTSTVTALLETVEVLLHKLSGISNGVSASTAILTIKDVAKQIEGRVLGVSTLTGTIRNQVRSYCYTGVYDYPDPIHPSGGSVTYINSAGTEVTKTGIWANEQVTIYASKIIRNSGAYTCGTEVGQDNFVSKYFSNSSSKSNCMGAGITTYPLHLYVTRVPIALGDKVYYDTSLNLPYNGTNQWYSVNSFLAYRIDSDGTVTAIDDCGAPM